MSKLCACMDRYFDRHFQGGESTAERLLADILRVDPRELIVAEPVFHDAALRPVFDVLGRVASPQPNPV